MNLPIFWETTVRIQKFLYYTRFGVFCNFILSGQLRVLLLCVQPPRILWANVWAVYGNRRWINLYVLRPRNEIKIYPENRPRRRFVARCILLYRTNLRSSTDLQNVRLLWTLQYINIYIHMHVGNGRNKAANPSPTKTSNRPTPSFTCTRILLTYNMLRVHTYYDVKRF